MQPESEMRDYGNPRLAHDEYKRLVKPIVDTFLNRTDKGRLELEQEQRSEEFQLYNSYDAFIERYPTPNSRRAIIEKLQSEAAQWAQAMERLEKLVVDCYPGLKDLMEFPSSSIDEEGFEKLFDPSE